MTLTVSRLKFNLRSFRFFSMAFLSVSPPFGRMSVLNAVSGAHGRANLHVGVRLYPLLAPKRGWRAQRPGSPPRQGWAFPTVRKALP